MNVPSFAAIIAHAFRLGQQGTLRDTVLEVAYATAVTLQRQMMSTSRVRHHPRRGMGGSLLLPAMALLTVGCARSLPVVQGKVLDARTGQPIASALVERRLFEKGPPDLVDSRTGDFVRGSFVKVTTDDQGRFELPAARVRALSGMAWFVYKPGWMPGFGCYQEEGWSSGSCGGSPAIVPDPYVKSSFVRHPDHIEMEVRVFLPTLEGVTLLTFDAKVGKFVPRPPDAGDDPWASYFGRLNTAVQDRYLDAEEFAEEATRYAKSHDLTPSIYNQIYQVQQSLGGVKETGEYNRPDLGLTLLNIQEESCKRHTGERPCSPDYFEHRRAFLREGLASNQRTAR